MVVPLVRRDYVIGLLALEQLDHCYDEGEEPQIAMTFANHAVMAIENARLYAELKALNEELEARVGQRTVQLREAKETVDRHARQLQHLLNKTIRIQEEERDRIAYEIHDSISQLLMGALYETQAARVCLPERPEMAQEKLQEAQNIMKQAKVEMQRIVFDLHPATLRESGLVPAVETYVNDYQEHTGIRCSFDTTGPTQRLPDARERAVYRVVQEALHNVARHAHASQSWVQLAFLPHMLQVTVEDDGQGFDPRMAENRHDHLGLMSMRERMQSVNGTLEVDTTPGQGTRIFARVPVDGEPSDPSGARIET